MYPMLMDRHNRVVDYLRISVTDRCNLRCIYCVPPEGIEPFPRQDVLSYEEIIRIARVAVAFGMRKIRLTGGEPLIRRDLCFLIRELRRIPDLTDLSMTTNGIRLAEFAHALRDSGLRRVNVSMDSLDPVRYARVTRGGDLELVWKGLLAALDAGLSPVKINVVAMGGLNAEEIIPFARLTIDWPFEVRFIEWMPIGAPADREEWSFIPADRILEILREEFILEPAKSSGNGPAQVFKIPGGKGALGVITPMTGHFCKECNRLRLTADGKLRSCLFSDDEIDLKSAIRSGASDAVIRSHLQMAIIKKPRGHHLRAADPRIKKCMRPMSRIGG